MDEDRVTKVKLPSPPLRTIEEYEADKAKGVMRYARAFDGNQWPAEKKRREELAAQGIDWRKHPPYSVGD